ncbi:MAG: transcription termination factor Rho [Opitutae bacterium]|nr:transcription termination factor Rho [Opitutae bacterium]
MSDQFTQNNLPFNRATAPAATNAAAVPATEPKPQQEVVEGVLVVDAKNVGTLRSPKRRGKSFPTDPIVGKEIIKRFRLRTGNWLVGKVFPRNAGFNAPAKISFVDSVDGVNPNSRRHYPQFQQLTSIAPDKQLRMETRDERLTNRVVDLFCPIGKGQRGLIVAPPRTGKTTLLKDIAAGVIENHPEVKVMVLLVDERPEEVTDFARDLPSAELYASSNDESPKTHIAIAEICIERARRLVEVGRDVLLLIDSITRLTRAYNNTRGGGNTMTGGLGSKAMEKPRQIFSSARNTEEAGSLTIVASALVQTGSRMDDIIFEEFKGTGNMEMVLDRKLAELRVFPAINLAASGTRKEELILAPDALAAASFLRRAVISGKVEDVAEAMLERLKKTKSNAEFIRLIRVG